MVQTEEMEGLLAENARLKEEVENLKRSLIRLETLQGSKEDISNKQIRSTVSPQALVNSRSGSHVL